MKDFVGEGTGRRVYKYFKNKVVKMAKNKAGVAQNKIEATASIDKNLCARVLDFDPSYEWVVMEYAPVVTEKEFENFSGFSQSIFRTYLDHHCFTVLTDDKVHAANINKEVLKQINFKLMDNNPFIKSLLKLSLDNRLSIGDLSRYDAWGRNEKTGNIVLFDYGLNWDVYKSCYTITERDYSMDGALYKKGCVLPNEDYEHLVKNGRKR
jgi:hypothetical protein